MDKQLRIAFIDYVLEPDRPGNSGLSDIVWEMASELTNKGHETHIVASYQTNQYPDDRVIVHNFPEPFMGYRNVLGHFLILKKAAKIVKALKPDIVHSPEYVSTAVFASLGVTSPLIFTVPGNIYQRIESGHSYEWHYVQVLKWAARTSAKQCKRVISVSDTMTEWWHWTGAAAENIIQIPYGITSQKFHPVLDARQQLGLSSQKLKFLFVGRFALEKGLLDLIEALLLLSKEQRNALKVFLVGKGPLLNEIKKNVTNNGLENVIEIHEWLNKNELALWYSAVDALILPSHSEAFSRTIPEAMSCGTPVIASDITGSKDHIHSNVNGFLFEPKCPEALAATLKKIISKPDCLHSIRQPTYKYAKENFNWETNVEKIVKNVYMPTLNRI